MKPLCSPCSLSLIGFFFLLVSLSPWASASTAETVNALQIRFDKTKASVISTIKSAPDHPDLLESGSLKATLDSALSRDLTDLRNALRLARTIMISERKSLATNNLLSESEKEELVATSQREGRPIATLGEDMSMFTAAIKDLRDNRLAQWQETYDSYKDAFGISRATDKLRGMVDLFCSPYIPRKPTPAPYQASSINASDNLKEHMPLKKALDYSVKTEAETGQELVSLQNKVDNAGLQIQNFSVLVTPIATPVPSPRRAEITQNATVSPRPQEGFFARKYKGFQILPSWALWALVIGGLLTVLAVKLDNDFLNVLLIIVAVGTIAWWFGDLTWRAVTTLFS